MPAAAAIILFGLFVAVVYLILRPFIEPPEHDAEEIVAPELESQKNRIIDAIREIDMDYQTGKLSEEDYNLLRSRYTSAAGEILRRIDSEASEAAPRGAEPAPDVQPLAEPPAEGDGDGSLDDEIEQQVAERKAGLGPTR